MSSRAFAAAKFSWIERIARDHRLLPIDVRVAAVLLSYFTEKDQDGRAFPSCKTIGGEIGTSEHTVIRAVRRLHSEGHLTVIWGQQGRGHPNQYWMSDAGKPAQVQVFEPDKTCTDDSRKPASSENKTCMGAGDSLEANPIGEGAPPLGESTLSNQGSEERGGERAASGGGARGAGRGGADARPPAAVREGGAGGDGAEVLEGEILEPENREAAWHDLRAIWQRGHVSDDAPAAQRSARKAFDSACAQIAPEAIIAAAQTWREAADAPKYLPKLSEWLDACGWTKPPPPKRKVHQPNGAGGPRYSNKRRWSGGGRRKESAASAMANLAMKLMDNDDE